jgi:hypothetical protein
MLSVVLPRWVDVVSTSFASPLFMPSFMLYLHISHVLCLQLSSICCTKYSVRRSPDTSVHIYLLYQPHKILSFSRFLHENVKFAENTHSINQRERDRRDVVLSLLEENRLRGTAKAWTGRTSFVMTKASSKAISMN